MQTLLRIGRIALIALALVLSVSVLSGATIASANSAPACVVSQPALTLTADKAGVWDGQTLHYTVKLSNTALHACDIVHARVVLTLPGHFGHPRGEVILLADTDLAAGQTKTYFAHYTLPLHTDLHAVTAKVEVNGMAVTPVSPPHHPVQGAVLLTVPVHHDTR